MSRTGPSVLRSQFLLGVKAQFSLGRRGRCRDPVEFEEEQSDSILDESIEILQHLSRGHELFVYQTLTIWGDQVATYTVRENVQKRRDRLVHRIREFPLIASPEKIVEAYWSVGDELRVLSVPPGGTQADRNRLQRIEARWLELSLAQAH